MAESIVFNNATYIIPDVGESNWGQNLTNFFVAIPQGCYQLSGGTQALTADLSFGPNFGLFAKYYTSVTANPATVGAVRLAKTDGIDWRNNANGGNLPLTIDGSDNLTFNGIIISGSGTGPVLSVSGTANQITASTLAGAVTLSIPATFIAPGSIAATTTLSGTAATLTNTSNQVVLGTTRTLTITAPTPASSSRTWTVPDITADGTFAALEGTQTFSGTKTFSSVASLTSSGSNPATAGIIRLAKTEAIEWRNNANGANLTLATDTSDRLLWNGNVIAGSSGLSITGTANQIVVTPSSTTTTLSTPQDIAAASSPTFAALTLTNTTNQLILGTTRTATITAPTPASSSRTYTFPDQSANYSVVATEGSQTINGAKTFTANLAAQASASGAKIQLGSDNTSNTASSDAFVYANVAGSSGGDAVFQASISSSSTWTFGLDNSDSDAFIISNTSALGTANRLRIDPTTTGVALVGTNTNDSAATGWIGEHVSASASTAITTAAYKTITSITLTAGDWDVSFMCYAPAAASAIEAIVGIATATDSSTGHVAGDNAGSLVFSGTFDGSLGCPAVRKSITGSTTYYLTAKTFGANQTLTGRISARRVR